MTNPATARHPGGNYDDEVAALLRSYLASKRMKKRELAQKLGQTDFWIGRRLNGQTPITTGELMTIADALNEPVSRFMPGQAAFGSEGWGFESLRVHPQRRRTDRRHLSIVPLRLSA